MNDTPMNIALLSGVEGNLVGKTRKHGIIQGITDEQLNNLGYVNLNVKTQHFTNWTYKGGEKAIKYVLKNYPDVNVIIAESDVCVLGAINELENAGKLNEILIVSGADGQKEALEYIINDGFYGCTAMNNPIHIGKAAVIYAIQYLNGKRDYPKTSFTPPLLITKENAADYYDPKAIF